MPTERVAAARETYKIAGARGRGGQAPRRVGQRIPCSGAMRRPATSWKRRRPSSTAENDLVNSLVEFRITYLNFYRDAGALVVSPEGLDHETSDALLASS